MVVLLLLGSASLVAFRVVKVKMLPFDNKSEFQVIVDMPEGTTLEQTARATREIGDVVAAEPEVLNYQVYVGTAVPVQLQRAGAALLPAAGAERGRPSGEPRCRRATGRPRATTSRRGSGRRSSRPPRVTAPNVKVAEVPPARRSSRRWWRRSTGPTTPGQIEVARKVKGILSKTEGVVDVDWYVEDDQPRYRFEVDPEKAALNGVSTEQVAETVRLAVDGTGAGLLHRAEEKEDVPIVLRLPRAERSRLDSLKAIRVMGRQGNLVPLGELVRVKEEIAEKSIYHKNLMPVVYVTADVAGKVESPVYAILSDRQGARQADAPRRVQARAARGGPAVSRPEAGDEVGRGVAHHLRGLPGPGRWRSRRCWC